VTAPVPVVCAVIERNNLILACCRGAGQSNAGLWEFPGGKVKTRESPRAALIRELREELGIEAFPHTALTPVPHAYPWITIELIPFICSLENGEPHPHEHAEVRWLDRESAEELSWAPADIPVVREYFSREANGKKAQHADDTEKTDLHG
jgi:8-oxo-dGTP diphosphatase